ncbi:hypothetical protein K443DRAFT_257328 [Laccaria amethystina LaAM-08-1]|uniref:Uncharacterized protein n=1 Tax=Laccaria amethystina LaAM-08-1 TaxID=1095629 RepID=A0A0C9WX28_9AGAR|nr:hypothetical protein K443DRAFT_257328 [Laccaria amethystina LaAM-08-1]
MARKPRLSWTIGLKYLVFIDISHCPRRPFSRASLQNPPALTIRALQHHADPHSPEPCSNHVAAPKYPSGDQGTRAMLSMFVDEHSMLVPTSIRECSPGPPPPPYPAMGGHESLIHGRQRHRKR